MEDLVVSTVLKLGVGLRDFPLDLELPDDYRSCPADASGGVRYGQFQKTVPWSDGAHRHLHATKYRRWDFHARWTADC